jgi:hypothetical protein
MVLVRPLQVFTVALSGPLCTGLHPGSASRDPVIFSFTPWHLWNIAVFASGIIKVLEVWAVPHVSSVTPVVINSILQKRDIPPVEEIAMESVTSWVTKWKLILVRAYPTMVFKATNRGINLPLSKNEWLLARVIPHLIELFGVPQDFNEQRYHSLRV